MISSDSEKDDSLGDELEQVLKVNKLHRGKHYKSSANEQLYRQALKEYMFGLFELASESCKKMIALNPENPEPYFMMANMHEQAASKRNSLSQLSKAVQFYFFHAYYSCPSIEKWLKAADLSSDLQLHSQAAYCYGRALKINSINIDIQLKRASALEKCQQTKKSLNIYKKIIERVSASLQVYKRYAKLQFSRKQFGKARQILMSYKDYNDDLNMLYMICETYLKQRNYGQLEEFIRDKVIAHELRNQEGGEGKVLSLNDLEIQFIQMLYICVVNNGSAATQSSNSNDHFDQASLHSYLVKYYQYEYKEIQHLSEEEKLEKVNELAELYEEIFEHITNHEEQIFMLLRELINYPKHQTIKNYLVLGNFYKAREQYQEALRVLQSAVRQKNHAGSMELHMQINHVQILLSQQTSQVTRVRRTTNVGNSKHRNSVVKMKEPEFSQGQHLEKEEIFYSDEDESLNKCLQDQHTHKQCMRQAANKGKKIKKKEKQANKSNIVIKDPQVISKMLLNIKETLLHIANDLELDGESQAGRTGCQLKKVRECLHYLVEVEGQGYERGRKGGFNPSRGIFSKSIKRKRRIFRHGQLSDRNIKIQFIEHNSETIILSIKAVVRIMKKCLRDELWGEVVELGQVFSKAKFFRWHSRVPDFRGLKVIIYEISILGCLQIQKYGKVLFFLRYLIHQHPSNKLYLQLAYEVLKITSHKNSLNSIINTSKDEEVGNSTNVELLYLIGLEHCSNCSFQLAITMFTRIISVLENQLKISPLSLQKNSLLLNCKLHISVCFIQIASSRNVANKMDHINRASLNFKIYLQQLSPTLTVQSSDVSQKIQGIFNLGRFYACLKLLPKAIDQFNKVLLFPQHAIEQATTKKLVLSTQSKAAYNLLIIYKQLEDHAMVQKIKLDYFPAKS